MENMQNTHGFTLLSKSYLSDVDSTAWRFEHQRSGATLLYLENDNRNKTFGIGFNTPPRDSSGCPHIVEHCVLSGSRKYKTREPFMDMIKYSMQTFLNAMTFPDMTIYPLSSQNEQDFFNLMDVYLDSVFFPRMLEKEEIFWQEGWHLELFDPAEEIKYNGVVYNEMRGAYSSPETQVMSQIAAALHPNSTYAHESGGYPYAIPSLSYQAFKDFHQSYYHPENSLIFLNGALPIEKTLQFINEEYLAKFARTGNKAAVQLGDSLAEVHKREFKYNVDSLDAEGKDSFLSYSVQLGLSSNLKEVLMASILNTVLIVSESSPLRRALMEAKLADDFIPYSADGAFSDFGFILKGVKADAQEEFVSIVNNCLAQICRDGLPKALVLAALNTEELEYRESGGSFKGVIWFIRAMMAFRSGNSPEAGLLFKDTLSELKAGLNSGELERYIETRILANPHKLIAVHRAQEGLFAQLDEEQKQKLAQLKAGLSPAELEKLIQANQSLRAFQLAEDSLEAKASLPHLDPQELPTDVLHIAAQQVELEQGKLFLIPAACAGISYLLATIDLSQLSLSECQNLALLRNLLAVVSTTQSSYVDLNNQIQQLCSGFSFKAAASAVLDEPLAQPRYLYIGTKMINGNEARVFALLAEVCQHSLFTDFERLHELIQTMRSDLEYFFENSGNVVAMTLVQRSFSPLATFNNAVSGLAYYDYICDLLDNWQSRRSALSTSLSQLAAKIFVRNNLSLCLTADSEILPAFAAQGKEFMSLFPQSPADSSAILFEAEPEAGSEAITSASSVLYNATGFNLQAHKQSYSGVQILLAHFLSADYLHNAIRARGGAYGAGLTIALNGDCLLYSYRDPNLANTYAAYQEIATYLSTLALTESDIRNLIVGAVGKFDPPLAASDLAAAFWSRHINHTDTTVLRRLLQEVKSCTLDELKAYAPIFKQALAPAPKVSYGNEGQIQAEHTLFRKIRTLKKQKK